VGNLNIAGNLAERRIALEIALDHHIRVLKAVWPTAGAQLDLQIAADQDGAFEQGESALIGLDIAGDRRRLVVPVHDERRAAPRVRSRCWSAAPTWGSPFPCNQEGITQYASLS
jgi:hypothetical protein